MIDSLEVEAWPLLWTFIRCAARSMSPPGN